MATSKQILEPWLASKKQWEKIFSLQLPTPSELLELMDSWSSFRQKTIVLAETPEKIPGGEIFFLDARTFLQSACTFFKVASAQNLPVVMNLAKKLQEASKEPAGKSSISIEIFESDFPRIIKKAEELKEERKAEQKRLDEEERLQIKRLQEEQRIQKISEQVEKDPFFIAVQEIQDKIQREITRIGGKNSKDSRLGPLKGVNSSLQQQIKKAKEESKSAYLSKEPGTKQEEIKSNCKIEMAKIVKTDLMDNNALDLKFRTWVGRAILNLIIALPVKIYSKSKSIPENQLFFKLKTESQANVEKIQEDIDHLKPIVKG
ncbi:hypothetical protein [Legionella sp. WA2022007384]